jgi:hypothetical protein
MVKEAQHMNAVWKITQSVLMRTFGSDSIRFAVCKLVSGNVAVVVEGLRRPDNTLDTIKSESIKYANKNVLVMGLNTYHIMDFFKETHFHIENNYGYPQKLNGPWKI